jgi:hypothetical protein
VPVPLPFHLSKVVYLTCSAQRQALAGQESGSCAGRPLFLLFNLFSILSAPHPEASSKLQASNLAEMSRTMAGDMASQYQMMEELGSE